MCAPEYPLRGNSQSLLWFDWETIMVDRPYPDGCQELCFLHESRRVYPLPGFSTILRRTLLQSLSHIPRIQIK